MTTTPITDIHPGRYWLGVANDTDDPIAMCGAALCGLLELLTERDEQDQKADSEEALVTELDEELNATRAQLEAVRAAVGKSTAGWADKIREALGDAANDGTGDAGQPAKDASLEDWQNYARRLGHGDLDGLNRSQIRTMLGISNA